MIKLFEEFNATDEPKVGDYVICDDMSTYQDTTVIKTLIGQIVYYEEIDKHGDYNDNPYCVQFNDHPLESTHLFMYEEDANADNCRWFNRGEIKYWSENKEDLIIYQRAGKSGLLGMKNEAINEDKPKVGDYVIVGDSGIKTEFAKYVQTIIGKLFYITDNAIIVECDNPPPKNVEYGFYKGGYRMSDNLRLDIKKPINPDKYYFYMGNFIKYWSENKEDLIIYQRAGKSGLLGMKNEAIYVGDDITKTKPKIGDYVILEDIKDLKFSDYLPMSAFDTAKMIGQITDIKFTLCYNRWDYVYEIQYEAPENFFPRSMDDNKKIGRKPAHIEHIKYWSENKEDLIAYLRADKSGLLGMKNESVKDEYKIGDIILYDNSINDTGDYKISKIVKDLIMPGEDYICISDNGNQYYLKISDILDCIDLNNEEEVIEFCSKYPELKKDLYKYFNKKQQSKYKYILRGDRGGLLGMKNEAIKYDTLRQYIGKEPMYDIILNYLKLIKEFKNAELIITRSVSTNRKVIKLVDFDWDVFSIMLTYKENDDTKITNVSLRMVYFSSTPNIKSSKPNDPIFKKIVDIYDILHNIFEAPVSEMVNIIKTATDEQLEEIATLGKIPSYMKRGNRAGLLSVKTNEAHTSTKARASIKGYKGGNEILTTFFSDYIWNGGDLSYNRALWEQEQKHKLPSFLDDEFAMLWFLYDGKWMWITKQKSENGTEQEVEKYVKERLLEKFKTAVNYEDLIKALDNAPKTIFNADDFLHYIENDELRKVYEFIYCVAFDLPDIKWVHRSNKLFGMKTESTEYKSIYWFIERAPISEIILYYIRLIQENPDAKFVVDEQFSAPLKPGRGNLSYVKPHNRPWIDDEDRVFTFYIQKDEYASLSIKDYSDIGLSNEVRITSPETEQKLFNKVIKIYNIVRDLASINKASILSLSEEDENEIMMTGEVPTHLKRSNTSGLWGVKTFEGYWDSLGYHEETAEDLFNEIKAKKISIEDLNTLDSSYIDTVFRDLIDGNKSDIVRYYCELGYDIKPMIKSIMRDIDKDRKYGEENDGFIDEEGLYMDDRFAEFFISLDKSFLPMIKDYISPELQEKYKEDLRAEKGGLWGMKTFEEFIKNKFVVKKKKFQLFSGDVLVSETGFNIEEPDEWFNEKYLTLHDLKTIEEFKGKGFAISLLEDIFSYVKNELDINIITLIVYKDNYKAVNLYYKTGFETFIEYEDSLCLLKRL